MFPTCKINNQSSPGSRQNRILSFEAKSKDQIITVLVPMAEILTYASELTSITGGRASFTMEFSHYEEVPGPWAEKIIEEAKKEKEG